MKNHVIVVNPVATIVNVTTRESPTSPHDITNSTPHTAFGTV